MALAAGAGQRDLALALREASALLGREAVVAARAAHPVFIQWLLLVAGTQGVTAGAAQFKMAWRESVTD